MTPIQIKPGKDGFLPYSIERLAKIKTVAGRIWHGPEKYWTVPNEGDMIPRLSALFADETIELLDGPHGPAPQPASERGEAQALLDRLRTAIRSRHFSPRTETAYVAWARRLEGIVRAKRPERLPVVLSKDEVRRVFAQMRGAPRLMAMLLYGSGLRLLECCRLRVKDLDWNQNQLVVRAGKGNKDRYTTLPSSLREPLQRHLEEVERIHHSDLSRGLGRVELPGALSRKYPTADKEWG